MILVLGSSQKRVGRRIIRNTVWSEMAFDGCQIKGEDKLWSCQRGSFGGRWGGGQFGSTNFGSQIGTAQSGVVMKESHAVDGQYELKDCS